MKSLRYRQAPNRLRQPAIAVHLIRDCAYRRATMWCDVTPDTYAGSATRYLIFESASGGGDAFATTARFQATCRKCLRMSLGPWHPHQSIRKTEAAE